MSQPVFRRIPLVLAVFAGCHDTTSPTPQPQFAQGDNGIWTVNTLADPGFGGCDEVECTLREAIAAAGSGDQIVFESSLTGNIQLAAGQLVIGTSLSIDGAGRIAVDAQDNSRVVSIGSGAGVTLSGLTLTRGNSDQSTGDEAGGGGAVRVRNAEATLVGVVLSRSFSESGGGMSVVDGTATIRNSIIADNFAVPVGGGINIDVNSTLTVINSTVARNRNGFEGGGITNRGLLTLIGSTVTNNAGGSTAGIENYGVASIVLSTISGNTTNFNSNVNTAGGITNYGTLELRSSTVTRNAQDGIAPSAGGLYSAGVATVVNSIIAGNSVVAGNPGGTNDCSVAGVTSLGHNLTTTDGGCAFSAVGDVKVATAQVFTEVLEQDLKDNGGPTSTHALVGDGHAIDAGSCPGETVDQRGFLRPFDDALTPNAADGCDIGAFELHLTAAEQVEFLVDAVSALGLATGSSTSLLAKLTNVLSALDAGDTAGACVGLSDFINELRAQSGKKKISASVAGSLAASAMAIRTQLGCS